MEKSFISTSAASTQQIGQNLATRLNGGDSVLLYGDLGSGKTTLAQGIAKGLGVQGHVNSPTFLIMRSYPIPEGVNAEILYHIDAYRLHDEHDAEGLGLSEIFSDKNAITLCEWPERLSSLLPESSLYIYCSYIDEEKRQIVIQNKKKGK